MEIRRGTLLAFDSGTWTASVLLVGSSRAVTVAVNRGLDDSELTQGRSVAVCFFDLANPGDSVLLAVWA